MRECLKLLYEQKFQKIWIFHVAWFSYLCKYRSKILATFFAWKTKSKKISSVLLCFETIPKFPHFGRRPISTRSMDHDAPHESECTYISAELRCGVLRRALCLYAVPCCLQTAQRDARRLCVHGTERSSRSAGACVAPLSFQHAALSPRMFMRAWQVPPKRGVGLTREKQRQSHKRSTLTRDYKSIYRNYFFNYVFFFFFVNAMFHMKCI